MIVRGYWEIDIDDSDGEPLGVCLDLAETEFNYCIKAKEIDSGSLVWKCFPEEPSIYSRKEG